MLTGMTAEVSHLIPCDDMLHCPWDEAKWYTATAEANSIDNTGAEYQDLVENKIKDDHLPPGYSKIDDRRYMLRYYLRIDLSPQPCI